MAAAAVAASAGIGRAQSARATAGIEAFNNALKTATQRMDNAATLALWEDDGVSLLPSTKPIAGKPAITAFLDRVTKDMPAKGMERFELTCHDLQASADWGSEWCEEHQVVRMANGSVFDGRGKMLLVLHRGADGAWRIHEEMWNQAAP